MAFAVERISLPKRLITWSANTVLKSIIPQPRREFTAGCRFEDRSSSVRRKDSPHLSWFQTKVTLPFFLFFSFLPLDDSSYCREIRTKVVGDYSNAEARSKSEEYSERSSRKFRNDRLGEWNFPERNAQQVGKFVTGRGARGLRWFCFRNIDTAYLLTNLPRPAGDNELISSAIVSLTSLEHTSLFRASLKYRRRGRKLVTHAASRNNWFHYRRIGARSSSPVSAVYSLCVYIYFNGAEFRQPCRAEKLNHAVEGRNAGDETSRTMVSIRSIHPAVLPKVLTFS